MLPTSFGSLCQAVSEEKIFQKSANQKQELSVVAMFVNESGQIVHSLQRTFHICFLPVSFHYFKRFQRRRFFQKSANQKQELPVVAMFVNESGQIVHSLKRTFHRCFLPVSVYYFKRFQRRRFFRNRPIRNKNFLQWPCLLTDWDEISNL